MRGDLTLTAIHFAIPTTRQRSKSGPALVDRGQGGGGGLSLEPEIGERSGGEGKRSALTTGKARDDRPRLISYPYVQHKTTWGGPKPISVSVLSSLGNFIRLLRSWVDDSQSGHGGSNMVLGGLTQRPWRNR